MGLGPTLVGGAIGAIAGMVLHLIVESTTGFEAPWFAVIIGLLTGLGVHQANKSLTGRVSYLRGAVSAAIALAAIVGSTPLISLVAKGRETAESTAAPIAGRDEAPGHERPAGDGGRAATTDGASTATGRDGATAVGLPAHAGRVGPKDPNWLQFVFMAVGTFIAYEFGRGTGSGAARSGAAPDEPITMTDPSN